jgi:murein DD-endopeptidase MepM/ murein hydrolase activator NlpD
MADEIEQKFPTGAIRNPKDDRDLLFATVAPQAETLPRKFSLKAQQSPVAQQKFGSCVGFANKSACEYHRRKQNKYDAISGRAIYAYCKQLDEMPDIEGTYPRMGLSVVFGKGLVLEKDFNNSKPPNSTHSQYIQLPDDAITEGAITRVMEGGFVLVRNLNELKQAIYKYGTVLVTVTVYSTFDNPESDGFIAKPSTKNHRGLHAIVATGWDDDFRGIGAIEIKNNWGTNWGKDGYAWLAYNYEGDGATPTMDMLAIVGKDTVDYVTTSGSPVNLSFPVDTATPVVTQAFGARPEYYAKYGMAGHNGLDFRTINTNKKILATDDGEIVFAGNDGSYGLSVRIKHKWGMSIYAHNSQIVVPLYGNDGLPYKVKKGQHIAMAGSTGDSSAEHCHFGIRINGVKNPNFFDWVDPSPFFGKDSMTKIFRILHQGKAGIMILEGFSGTVLFEDKLSEYQTLLQISNATNAPIIKVPAGKFFKIDDSGKLGIMILEGFSGAILFEDKFGEYQTLLQITGVPSDAYTIQIPSQ